MPSNQPTAPASLAVIKGKVFQEYRAGDHLDQLVWPRSAEVPAADVPVAEIIDLLAAVGDHLRADTGGYLAAALSGFAATSDNAPDLLERAYGNIWRAFQPDLLRFQVDSELGGAEVIDTWRPVTLPGGGTGAVRAFPSRIVHILAGNGPGVASMSIVRGALTKSASLFKLPSNDRWTAPALLRHLAAVAPEHPVTRSFSALYWPGGDENVERVLLSALWFDKIVAWGGDTAIRAAARRLGPGLELISFDPKSSVSFVGREAFASDEALRAAAVGAAIDATIHDQNACTASRFQYVEGDLDEVDRFCAVLVSELGVAREKASARSSAVPADVREEIEALRGLEPEYRVWGRYDGSGMVIRSDEPVEFYPTGRVVNVVPVKRLDDAVRQVSVATQTVGIYPDSRRPELRDALCAAGAQRITALGRAGELTSGLPHDGFFPMARFVRWSRDD
jgi:Acyl-CoA reductase (LuxC)